MLINKSLKGILFIAVTVILIVTVDYYTLKKDDLSNTIHSFDENNIVNVSNVIDTKENPKEFIPYKLISINNAMLKAKEENKYLLYIELLNESVQTITPSFIMGTSDYIDEIAIEMLNDDIMYSGSDKDSRMVKENAEMYILSLSDEIMDDVEPKSEGTTSGEATVIDPSAASGGAIGTDTSEVDGEEVDMDPGATNVGNIDTNTSEADEGAASSNMIVPSGGDINTETSAASGEAISTDTSAASGEAISTDTSAASGEAISIDSSAASGEAISTDSSAASGEAISIDTSAASGEAISIDASASSGEAISIDTSASSGEAISIDSTAASGEAINIDTSASSGEAISIDSSAASGGAISTDKTAVSGGAIKQVEMIDNDAPEIVINNNQLIDTKIFVPYTIPITIIEKGENISGIADVFYTINDSEPVFPALYDTTEIAGKGSDDMVLNTGNFVISFEEAGAYTLSVTASDVNGNSRTVEYQIIVEKDNAIVSINLPTTVNITIDPYEVAGKGKIYSDIIEISNLSNRDIRVSLKTATLKINRNYNEKDKNCVLKLNEISEVPEIYNKNLEQNEKITLAEGNHEKDYDFVLSKATYSEDDILLEQTEESVYKFQITGDISENSEPTWRSGDIQMSLIYEFEVIPETKDIY